MNCQLMQSLHVLHRTVFHVTALLQECTFYHEPLKYCIYQVTPVSLPYVHAYCKYIRMYICGNECIVSYSLPMQYNV